MLHGTLVLRAPPGGMLGLVAIRTRRATDERRRARGGGLGRARPAVGGDGFGVALPAVAPEAEVTPPPPQRSTDKHREAGGEAGQLQASSGGVSVLGRDKRPSSRPSC
jgi:hypothetical protein